MVNENIPTQRRLLFALLAVSAMVLAGAIAARRETVVGLHRPIVHDDWAFSVFDLARADDGGGVRLVVTLDVENHARRVPYRFLPLRAIVVDGSGRTYDATRVDGTTPAAAAVVIPPGGSRRFVLEYRVGVGASRPRLRITTGGPVGDAMDAIFAGKQSIDLDAPGADSAGGRG